ncbi:Ribosomal protein L7/L12, oligomerization [Dillenia turbinata]|uniref:Ribosomal protein L7/L12, oligomerization n=1 Tax=Dillenia turbinata TaxID=194707 RepID=A0AAN8V3J0_9MAGN
MSYSKILSSRNLRFVLQNPKLNKFANPNFDFLNHYTTAPSESPSPQSPPKFIVSENVAALVDEIAGLTLLEVSDLTEVLRKKLDITEMPVMAVMMPGMGFGVKGPTKGGGGAVKGEEKKAEKTAFDLKLEGFDAAAKIKIIKEVRTFTDLGLKEAKDLVEKAPTLLKKGVTKEEAEKIIEKMKEVGAKVTME